jgi:hypothetical protein
MEKARHLSMLRNALLNIAPEYFKTQSLNGRVQIEERIFAYELYHQLRIAYSGWNWYINGEFRKGLSFLPDYGLTNTLVPDLVIHEHGTTVNNAVVIEIKTDPGVTGSQIIEDLKKLEIYTRPGTGFLDYKIGVMLIVNSNFTQKFQGMREENQVAIREMLDYGRTAIWNISVPETRETSGSEVRLNEGCLSIIHRV